MEAFYYTIVGYLKSAQFIANNMKKPNVARDLLNYELIIPGLSTRLKLLAIAKKENIDIDIDSLLKNNKQRKSNKVESIYNFKMSVRLKNILLHHKIQSIEELSKYTRKQALAFRNAGQKSIDELESFMAQYGVFFKT